MFLGDPHRPEGEPPPAAAVLRWLGTAASVLAAVAASQTWVSVQFPRVWGEVEGPRGWQEPAGFTCLIASAFTVVLAMLETRSRASARAVQPGLLAMAIIAAAAMLWRALGGPGSLRGVSTVFTVWFLVALGAAIAAALAAVARFALLRRSGWF